MFSVNWCICIQGVPLSRDWECSNLIKSFDEWLADTQCCYESGGLYCKKFVGWWVSRIPESAKKSLGNYDLCHRSRDSLIAKDWASQTLRIFSLLNYSRVFTSQDFSDLQNLTRAKGTKLVIIFLLQNAN